MRKALKKGISLCMAVFAATACFSSCGEVEEVFDANKTQLFVKVFNGGAGTTWIEKIRDDFNSKNDKYAPTVPNISAAFTSPSRRASCLAAKERWPRPWGA